MPATTVTYNYLLTTRVFVYGNCLNKTNLKAEGVVNELNKWLLANKLRIKTTLATAFSAERYVTFSLWHDRMSRPSLLHSRQTLELFDKFFALQFVLKFWAKIEWVLGIFGYEKLAFFRPLSRFILKTVQDTAIVTMEDEYEIVCDLLNGAISNDLQ